MGKQSKNARNLKPQRDLSMGALVIVHAGSYGGLRENYF